ICKVAAFFDRPLFRVDVGDLRSLEPLQGQYPAARVAPEDARDMNVWMPGEVAMERVCVPRFEPVVQLLTDLARELVHELVRVDEIERPDTLLRDTCRLIEQRE